MCFLRLSCCAVMLLLSSGASAELTKEQMYDGVDVSLKSFSDRKKSVDKAAQNNGGFLGNSEVELIVVSKYLANSDEMPDVDVTNYRPNALKKITGERKPNVVAGTSRTDRKLDSPLTGSPIGFGERDPMGQLTSARMPTAADFDPFKTILRWDWKTDVSVGNAMKKLAKVVGYSLIVRDSRVGNVYSMPLPYAHRRARRVDVRTGLEFLGGPALMVVVDHTNRTIMHMVRSEYPPAYDAASLPRCKPNVTFGVMPAGSTLDRVLIVEGKKCVY